MNPHSPSRKATPREWLLARQADLLARIEAAERGVLSLGSEGGAGEVTDLKEQANRHERDAILDAEVLRDREELVSVHAALARLDDGTFGFCIDCGQDIDTHRLDAMPAAARCVECQSRCEMCARISQL